MSANQNLRRAVELARDGDLESALAEVKRALELEPGHEKGLVFRFTLEARLLRRAARFGDAAVRYHAVLALDPDNREARHMLRELSARENSAAPARPTASDLMRADESAQRKRTSQSGEHWSAPPTGPPPANEAPMVSQRKGPSVQSQSAVKPPHKTAPSPPTLSARLIEPHAASESGPDDELQDKASFDAMTSDLPPPSTEMPLEPERRGARRVAIEVDVGVSSESNFFTGFSGDISEGGLFIATYNLVPVGSHVHVAFGVMGREISCDAVVCWIRDPIDVNLMPGFGVRFGELSDADHAAIAKFIHTRAPMFYDDD